MRVGAPLLAACCTLAPHRHCAPLCQFGDFKLPELPDFMPKAEEPAKGPSPPAKKQKNPLEKFVEAFTPVEVDRDGNVVAEGAAQGWKDLAERP